MTEYGPTQAGSAYYRTIVENAQDAIFIIARDGTVDFVNEFAARLLGRPAAELIGRPRADIFSGTAAASQAASIREVFTHGVPVYAETWTQFSSGEICLGTRLVPLSDDTGKVAAILGISRDITEQRRAERALVESQRHTQLVLGHISEVIYVVHATYDERFEGRVEMVGGNITAILGWEGREFAADPTLWLRSIHPDDLPAVTAATDSIYRTGKPGWREYRMRRRDSDTHIWIEDRVVPQLDATGKVIGFVGVARDVTERRLAAEALRRSEEMLLQSQRLEAVGRLAGGVAHDFNNLLTAVLGYAEILLTGIDPSHAHHEPAREIVRAAESAAALTSQLLAFSRKQVFTLRVLDLNTVVSRFEGMLRRIIGEDVNLVIKLKPGLGSVEADPTQIEQVLMNLAVNARDAMPRGGTLTIATDDHGPDGLPDAESTPPSVPAGWVVLTVADTGTGIDSAVLPHIFEPFFTTKARGRGTGLGLATVYGIIAQSGGKIDVVSDPGKGACFHIRLPRTNDTLHLESPVQPSHDRGHETILLVEDDDSVRTLTARLLVAAGYRVIASSLPTEALELCAAHPSNIDMLLTDIVMPGMNGFELARRVAVLRPGIRILGVTGYSEREVPFPIDDDAAIPLLQKPFRADVLLARVRSTLHGDHDRS